MMNAAGKVRVQSMREAKFRENIAGYLFMAPALLFFFGFVIFPMGMCLYTSFFNYTMTDFSFIGFGNYAEMFGDAVFIKALTNTIIIVLVSVPFTCFFSLWAATLIYRMRNRWAGLFRCVFYLPVVTGSVAVTVVWKWIFNRYYGILNYLLVNMGVIGRSINWLGDAQYALGCIITILLTTSVGQPIVLYVSALSNVDHSLIEAAEVDGATNICHLQYPAAGRRRPDARAVHGDAQKPAGHRRQEFLDAHPGHPDLRPPGRGELRGVQRA